jgi:hypothetical protein
MKTVSIPVQRTPESFVRKYISNKLGFNIRLGETKRNNDGTWTITLKAVIPSFVKLNDNASKTFVYTFDNIGSATVKYEDYDFDFVEKPKAPDLDLELIRKIDELTMNVQKVILEYGKFKWGKITAIRYLFGSIHSIIVRSLKEEGFFAEAVPKKYIRYFNFLQSIDWLNAERQNKKTWITPSNKLSKLHEMLLNKKLVEDDINSVADALIGHIYAEHFSKIRDELRFNLSTIYITTTKGYYADAVREGRSIPMDYDTLWFRFRTYNYKSQSNTHRLYRFPDVVGELVANDFLRFSKDKNHVVAVPELLQRLLPFKPELTQNVMDI